MDPGGSKNNPETTTAPPPAPGSGAAFADGSAAAGEPPPRRVSAGGAGGGGIAGNLAARLARASFGRPAGKGVYGVVEMQRPRAAYSSHSCPPSTIAASHGRSTDRL